MQEVAVVVLLEVVVEEVLDRMEYSLKVAFHQEAVPYLPAEMEEMGVAVAAVVLSPHLLAME